MGMNDTNCKLSSKCNHVYSLVLAKDICGGEGGLEKSRGEVCVYVLHI